MHEAQFADVLRDDGERVQRAPIGFVVTPGNFG